MKTRQGFLPLLLLHVLLFYPLLSHAQQAPMSPDTIDPLIAGASSLLQQLDRLAGQCQQSSPDSEKCSEFLEAVDGKIIADYLDHCSRLENWKQELLREVLTSNTDTANSSIQLQRIARVENICGDTALENNTQFVFPAFNALRQQGIDSRPADAVSRRVSELEFSILENAERRSLQNSLRQQQLRRQQETEQQIISQQNELLRQQIDRRD